MPVGAEGRLKGTVTAGTLCLWSGPRCSLGSGVWVSCTTGFLSPVCESWAPALQPLLALQYRSEEDDMCLAPAQLPASLSRPFLQQPLPLPSHWLQSTCGLWPEPLHKIAPRSQSAQSLQPLVWERPAHGGAWENIMAGASVALRSSPRAGTQRMGLGLCPGETAEPAAGWGLWAQAKGCSEGASRSSAHWALCSSSL